jgi:hypothetical protein
MEPARPSALQRVGQEVIIGTLGTSAYRNPTVTVTCAPRAALEEGGSTPSAGG